jgi:hypothetical protein
MPHHVVRCPYRPGIELKKIHCARVVAKLVEQKLKENLDFQMMSACFANPSSADTQRLSREYEAQLLVDPDPEPHYIVAADFLFCGQKDLTLQLLKSAIAGHYCAYDGLRNDSIWTNLRGTPEFAELVAAAKQCQADFLAQRSQPTH